MSEEISFEDFLKVDMRVGTVVAAKAVPKSELLQLDVSFGDLGNRTILARIGKSFNPDGLVDTQVIAVVNLAPREMKGVMSHGMLLAAKDKDGNLGLATLSDHVGNGSTVG